MGAGKVVGLVGVSGGGLLLLPKLSEPLSVVLVITGIGIVLFPVVFDTLRLAGGVILDSYFESCSVVVVAVVGLLNETLPYGLRIYLGVSNRLVWLVSNSSNRYSPLGIFLTYCLSLLSSSLSLLAEPLDGSSGC